MVPGEVEERRNYNEEENLDTNRHWNKDIIYNWGQGGGMWGYREEVIETMYGTDDLSLTPHTERLASRHVCIPSTQANEQRNKNKKWELSLKNLNDLHGRSIQEVQHLTNNVSYKRKADKIGVRRLSKK